jgi:predicted GH43/DUF377 family glycosyl hydrolase
VLNPAGRPAGVVTRTEIRIRPDPRRVVTRLFVPGEELPSDASRAHPLIERILSMNEDQAAALLDDVISRFGTRHRDFRSVLNKNFEQVSAAVSADADLSETRRALMGAYFTAEYSIEAADLCNPSMVAHPDQSGLKPDQTRFVLSLRGIGEGHISSIEFRTGIIDAGGIHVDPPGVQLLPGTYGSAVHHKTRVKAQLAAAGHAGGIATVILGSLPEQFTNDQLESALGSLHRQALTRRVTHDTIDALRTITGANYAVSFPAESRIDERVLFPHGPAESRGMEDARFVRFTDDDDHVTYYATYTAFDGARIVPQILQTDDFATFSVSQLHGPVATNKGLAIFPRKINGRFALLSRWDRERNTFASSDDAWSWDRPVTVHAPEQPWELVQVGNCGSPIETPEGWLVLTHGVGPMRTYSIGALLLDLDQPWRARAALTTPLMVPDSTEREGYVPNVLYSCGSMRHGDTVVLPYGCSDYGTSVAFVDLPGLMDCLLKA